MSLKIHVVSPHIDDAAFSLALHMAQFVAGKIPVTLVNCFTISAFTTIDCGIKGKDAVSLLRKKEDQNFNTIFNSAINIANLDLLDAPLRNNYIHKFYPFNTEEVALIETIEKYLDAQADGIILCPLAFGNHIDHNICIEAVIKLHQHKQVLFYEDLPYTSRVDQEEMDAHIKNLEERLNVKLVSNIYGQPNSKINKEQIIRVYNSQVNDEIVAEITSYLNKLGGERLWGTVETIDNLKNALNF